MLVTFLRNFTNKVSIRFIRIEILSNGCKSFSSMAKAHDAEEQKINVNGVDINYLRVGTGNHPVLLLPGALGSIWTDFKPQIEGLDRGKFTVVAWDPLGCGKSRPPDRTFPDDFFQRDAAHACNLMKLLGYPRFSLVGWSDGGITSLMLAAMFPENVQKMVSVAANAYVTPEELEIYQKYRNVDTWSEKMRAPMIAIYGEEYFRKTWSDWVEAFSRISKKQNGDLCRDMLPKIQCPTLIVQGSKDPMVVAEHPLYLQKHITGAKLKIFENGAHNLHLRYPKEFNDLVTEFLIE
ncbi:PREDICTED: valacyclovir hydrolase [Dufourea novaeangliae]|uniref:valacyclovir hydrolase n=1 Tax=Dufourea novaeangliae TaxID=178035 RepID=UPI000766F784|nr:PREDICTED: valacyclovir hydrolase [Dufourea novaeangliae]